MQLHDASLQTDSYKLEKFAIITDNLLKLLTQWAAMVKKWWISSRYREQGRGHTFSSI